MTITMTITYTKLKSGAWGLRGPVDMTAGDVVRVAKRDGTSKTETIGKIVHRGADYALATIAEDTRARRCTPRGSWDQGQRMIDRQYGRRLTPADGAAYYSSGQYDLDS